MSFLTMFRGASYTAALERLVADHSTRVLCIHGDADQFTGASTYSAWSERLDHKASESGENEAPPLRVVVIEGGDHFWRGEAQRKAMMAAVAEWV